MRFACQKPHIAQRLEDAARGRTLDGRHGSGFAWRHLKVWALKKGALEPFDRDRQKVEMTMSKTYGVGIMGAGNISSAYLRLAPMFKGLEVRGIADIVPAAAKKSRLDRRS